VHAITELADIARANLARMQPQSQMPSQSQNGWEAEPVAGPPPGPGGIRSGLLGGGMQMPGRRGRFGYDVPDSAGDLVGDVIGGVAAQFIGRAIQRKVEQTVTNRVMPAMNQAAAHWQNQIAVAEKYPSLRACMTDRVAFLDGGYVTAPLPDLNQITVAEADALIAQLQG
jgi:hypothetical protein